MVKIDHEVTQLMEYIHVPLFFHISNLNEKRTQILIIGQFERHSFI